MGHLFVMKKGNKEVVATDRMWQEPVIAEEKRK
jgi:hypothetical protein